jgi:subtilisin family serine protease
VLVDPVDETALDDLASEHGATVLGPVEGTDFYVVEAPQGISASDFLDDIEHDPRVEESHEDDGCGIPEGGLSTVPLFGGDPLAAIPSQPAMTAIGAPVALTRYGGVGVIVAVVDTGISATHPSIAGRLAAGGIDLVDGDADPADVGNGLDDDGDGLIDEGVGHGTFVASLVLAVAPDARILPIRALDSDATGTISRIANGIAYAVSHGAHVINLSVGLPQGSSVLQQAVQNARGRGVAVIAAAGNRGGATVDFPATMSEVLAVTGLAGSTQKASFASYGSAVDLSAPAVEVIGAHPLSPTLTARWSGTSFSTALVTGGYALLKQRTPSAEVGTLFERLMLTATNVDGFNVGFAGKIGRGRLNLDAATSGSP